MNYQNLLDQLKINFSKPELLDIVFTHKSYVNEAKKEIKHNERMEFLGDAVLELVVTDYLYQKYDHPEGDLTNWRAALVRGKNLAAIATGLHLGDYLKLSKGEELSNGREKGYILANTFEALIGAIYLDKGFEVAKKFINKYVTTYLEEIINKKLYIDAKTLLQERAQGKMAKTPSYEVLEEEGPAHEKIFTVGVYIGDKLHGQGKGSSKQKAEENAAKEALKNLGWEI